MKKNKLIFTVIVVILVNTLVAFGWYYTASSINNSDTEILGIRHQTRTNEIKLANISSLDRLVGELEEEKSEINAVFLNKQNIIKFIEKIESIAESTNVVLKFGQLNVDTQEGELPKVSFVVKGSFEEVFRFLVLLENNTYVVSVDSLSFRETQAPEWQGVFGVSINSFLSL